MAQPGSNSKGVLPVTETGKVCYWRVEGSLLELGALRPVGFFTWNSQSFAERWARRAGMAGMAIARPFAYFASRTFATRFLHTLLRGVSRDRLDLLGEEYFHYVLKPQLRREAAQKLVEAVHNGERVILVGQLLENVLRPLAHHFGGESIISNCSRIGPTLARSRCLLGATAHRPHSGASKRSSRNLQPSTRFRITMPGSSAHF